MELAKSQLTKPISMEIALCIIRMFNLNNKSKFIIFLCRMRNFTNLRVLIVKSGGILKAIKNSIHYFSVISQRPTEVKRPAATIELRPSVLRPTKSARGFPPTEQDVLVLQPSF